MYAELYEYLLLNDILPLPGVGNFVVQRNAARADFPSKLIYPPQYLIEWKEGDESPAVGLWNWLAHSLGVSVQDARLQLEHFTALLKSSIASGAVIDWKGLGTIDKDLSGNLRFQPSEHALKPAPVAAHKVLREKSEHTVRVGEDERTAEQMTEMLSEKPVRKITKWWIAAGILGLLSLGFLAWHFSWNSGKLMTGNQHALKAGKESISTYRQVP